MYTKVGDAVLTQQVSCALAKFQDSDVETFCDMLDGVIGTIIDLKTDNEVNSDELLATIGDIRYLTYCLKELVPQEKEGGIA